MLGAGDSIDCARALDTAGDGSRLHSFSASAYEDVRRLEKLRSQYDALEASAGFHEYKSLSPRSAVKVTVFVRQSGPPGTPPLQRKG